MVHNLIKQKSTNFMAQFPIANGDRCRFRHPSFNYILIIGGYSTNKLPLLTTFLIY